MIDELHGENSYMAECCVLYKITLKSEKQYLAVSHELLATCSSSYLFTLSSGQLRHNYNNDIDIINTDEDLFLNSLFELNLLCQKSRIRIMVPDIFELKLLCQKSRIRIVLFSTNQLKLSTFHVHYMSCFFQNWSCNFIYTFRICYRILVEFSVPYNYCFLEVIQLCRKGIRTRLPSVIVLRPHGRKKILYDRGRIAQVAENLIRPGSYSPGRWTLSCV